MQPLNFSEDSLDFFSKTALLSGLKPVLELLEKEPQKIDLIWIQKRLFSKEIRKIIELCHQKNIRFTFSSVQNLNQFCLTNHQGVIARLFETGFTDIHILLDATLNAPLPLILMLDQIQDPGNVGTLIRTLYALGGAGIIIPKHNSAFLGPDSRRAAVGTLEQIPIAKVTNLSRTLEYIEQKEFHIYGSSIDPLSQNVFDIPLKMPAVLVLGNEKSGIRLQLRKRCHTMLHIPMIRETNSLNVAQAGGILISYFLRNQLLP